jgi:hypothetical protein
MASTEDTSIELFGLKSSAGLLDPRSYSAKRGLCRVPHMARDLDLMSEQWHAAPVTACICRPLDPQTIQSFPDAVF